MWFFFKYSQMLNIKNEKWSRSGCHAVKKKSEQIQLVLAWEHFKVARGYGTILGSLGLVYLIFSVHLCIFATQCFGKTIQPFLNNWDHIKMKHFTKEARNLHFFCISLHFYKLKFVCVDYFLCCDTEN